MEHFCNTNLIIDKHVIKNIENICFNRFKEQWYIDLMSNERSKLRTYRLFKNEFGEENYLLKIIPGKYRSAYAKFRSGTAPLKIETGRYEGLLVENRICYNSICNENLLIEDEKHVLMNCPVYEDLRCYLFYQASLFNVNFMQLSDDDKFIFLFTDENMYFYIAKICNDILLKRKCILYS